MNTKRIQAAFARKRETEHIRNVTTNANNDYFDHWNKVNTRFETWTTPEYYHNANIQLRKSKDKERRDAILCEKRKRLQLLFDNEKTQYDNEILSHMQGKTTHTKPCHLNTIPTHILQEIDKNLKVSAEERRRLELEAKLYASWRQIPIGNRCNSARSNNSKFNENLLYDSKSDHQAMAKLCWLDKQIENQMKRENDAKESEIRNLQIQEELRKHEETLKERQQIRESELKELRAILENHVQELKQREQDYTTLQRTEIDIENQLKLLANEKDDLKTRFAAIEIYTNQQQNNIARIKMLFRERSLIFCQAIRNDIDVLLRINKQDNNYETEIFQLIEKYKRQLNEENCNQLLIKNMFESEAKENLQKWESLWYCELQNRQITLKNFIDIFTKNLEHKLEVNISSQQQLKIICESHLSAIDNTNAKLRVLISETIVEEPPSKPIPEKSAGKSSKSNELDCSGRQVQNILNENFGCNKCPLNEIGPHGDNYDNNSNNNLNQNHKNQLKSCNPNNCVGGGAVGIGDTATTAGGAGGDCRPKYGRKKIAWN